MKWFSWLLFFCVSLSSCTGDDSATPGDEKTSTSPAIAEGKTLFYSRCASCHMVNKELTGPALRGVEQRWPDKQKLHAFVRNSQAVIQQDAYAHDLWLRFNQTKMTEQPDLSDAQIDHILEYINSVSEPGKP